jgi:hypothetical protein
MIGAISNDISTWFTLVDEDEKNILEDIAKNPNFGPDQKRKYEMIQANLLDSASKFKNQAWEEVKACWNEFRTLIFTAVDERIINANKYDLIATKLEAQASRIKNAIIEREKADIISALAKKTLFEEFQEKQNLIAEKESYDKGWIELDDSDEIEEVEEID